MLGHRYLKVLVVGALASTSHLAQGAEGRFRAVVAIATQYTNQLSPQPTLASAVPRVEQALKALAKKAGYPDDKVDIRILVDSPAGSARLGPSTADEIRRAVWDAAVESTGVSDTLVFYFTGHGGSDGVNTLLYASGADGYRPVARVQLRTEIISTAWKQSPAGVKLIIVDACQTSEGRTFAAVGPLLGYGARAALSRLDRTDRLEGQGTALLMSADEGQRAWVDTSVGFGYFTRYLIDELVRGEHETVQQLFAAIRERVSAGARLQVGRPEDVQQPILEVLGSPGGDYVLVAQTTVRTRDRARDAQTFAAARALRDTVSGLSAPLAAAINLVNGEKALPGRPSDLLKYRNPTARKELVNIENFAEAFRSSLPGPAAQRPDLGAFLCSQTARGLRALMDSFVSQSSLGYEIAELANDVVSDRTALSFIQRTPCGARHAGDPLSKLLPSEGTRQYVEKLIALQDRLAEVERVVSAP